MIFMIDKVVRVLLIPAVAGGLALACNDDAETPAETLTDEKETAATVPYEPPTPVNGVSVEPVKRYVDGQVITLNRLQVDWYNGNEECQKLNPKYGNTTADLLYDNVRGVLKDFGTLPAIRKDFEKHGIFQQGFAFGSSSTESFISVGISNDSVWMDKDYFVRESIEDVATLIRLGNEIRDNACNDPEKTSLDHKLNSHMYNAKGVMKPIYAPKTLAL